jgi:hypothetical protein
MDCRFVALRAADCQHTAVAPFHQYNRSALLVTDIELPSSSGNVRAFRPKKSVSTIPTAISLWLAKPTAA